MGSGSQNIKLLKELDLLTLKVLTSNNKQIAHEYNHYLHQMTGAPTIQQISAAATSLLVQSEKADVFNVPGK